MNKKQNRKNTEQGFSLIEILVVLLIIGLLTTMVAINVLPSQDKARVDKAKADIAILGSALEMYRLDRFRYPNTQEGLRFLINPQSNDYSNSRNQAYIKKLPQDPWGNDYIYLSPGDHGEYDLYSMGADGQRGGELLNKDIVNWDDQLE